MSKTYSILRDRLSPEARAKALEKANAMVRQIDGKAVLKAAAAMLVCIGIALLPLLGTQWLLWAVLGALMVFGFGCSCLGFYILFRDN